MKHFLSSALALSALATTALAAIAEPAAPAPIRSSDYQQVIVTADPLGRSESSLSRPVSVLQREEILRAGTQTIGQAVSKTPGVNVADFSGSVGRPVIRGLTGARVRVLNDGIGAMDVSSLSPDHAVAVDPLFARQIEILRGPATLRYGSGAIGGLVNVVDDRILERLPATLTGEASGHYDSVSEGRTGGLGLSTALGKQFALHLEGMAQGNESYGIPGFAETRPDPDEAPGTLENSQGEHWNFSGGLSYIGARGFLGFAVQQMERNYGVPGHHHHHEEEGGGALEPEEEGGVTIDQAQTRIDVKGELRDPLPGIAAARIRWGVNDHQHAEIEPSGEMATLLGNDEWEGRIEAEHLPIGPLTGVFGIQLQDRDFTATGEEAFVPDSVQRAVAAFMVEQAVFGDLRVDFGLRYEHNEAEALAVRETSTFDLYGVSSGVAYVLMPGYEIGSSFTVAGRAPSIEELFASGPHLATNTYEIGDAGLESELARNLDLFWRKTGGRLTLDLGFFYNDISDFVFAEEQDTNGDGIADRVEPDFGDTGLVVDEAEALLLIRQRQQDAWFWGFEMAAGLLLIDDARGQLRWRLWTDFVEAELDSGERVPRLPALRFGSGLIWQHERWTAYLDLTRAMSQDSTAALETPTDGYTLLDIGLEHHWQVSGSRELTVFARGNNLLDEEVRRHPSFIKDQAPAPGASALLGLRLRF